MSNGNGHGENPKWLSYIDQWVREIMSTMAKKKESLGVRPHEEQQCEISIGRALIYAGCTILYATHQQEVKPTVEVVDAIIDSFFGEIGGGYGGSESN